MEQNLSAPQSQYVINKVGKKESRFSILDVLIILSALFVVGLLAYLIINPDKESSDLRNVHRSADISAILTSVVAYVNIHGDIPEEIPMADNCVTYGNEICKSGSSDCTDLVDISFLNSSNTDDVFNVPVDPQNLSVNGTGYYIYHNGEGEISVCAPYAERNVEISFSKYIY
jgi:hypothetical protein